MRKIYVAALLLAASYSTTQAQQFRINAYSGYTFDDRVSSYYNNFDYYEGTIKGGYRWGLGAEYMANRRYGIELSYLRQDTEAPVSYFNIVERRNTLDLAANWITLAGTHHMPLSEVAEPYGGVLIGAAVFNVRNPENDRSRTATKFAWGVRLGANLFFSRAVGIKLQTDLLSAAQGFGGGVYFGGGGAATSLTSYSTMLQFHLGGGLVFRFGDL